ncbi:MAG: filamentous hemagglutinin N-terminal domain-containing protein [Verrucomicrobiae bacterium]|nr:filamentous hemagglutinin N-terminal domain-containing protein [Verrucomicrobiae bacterium]
MKIASQRPGTPGTVTLLLANAVAWAPVAWSNPAGMTVQSGSASLTIQGAQTTINASHNAVLNWQQFNIAPGETTTFVQPSAQSIVWNHIHDSQPSQIWGNLNANGVVVLMNGAGFHFGPDAFVSTAGLVVSTAPAIPMESGSGPFWQFQGLPPSASIVNYGRIRIGEAGSAFLIAERVENHGEIAAPGGRIGLLAAREVLISERPDGRGLSAAVSLPEGAVNQAGRLVADAGTVALHARVVNQDGLIQANSVRERNGVIELIASDSVTLGALSAMSASGGGEGISNGGKIIIQSERSFSDAPTSTLAVRGGSEGGNGGFVEVSAPEMPAIRSTLEGSAASGGAGGRLLIDPVDIVIGQSGGGSAGGGTVGADDPPTTLFLDVNTAFIGFAQIELQATRDITIAAGTLWDLAASTGQSAPGSRLSLEAGNNVSIADGAGILAGEHWSVSLAAGRDFSTPDGIVPVAVVPNQPRPRQHSVFFEGAGFLESANGAVEIRAGLDVTVAGGFVRSTSGGSISVEALGGNINTGTRANGFIFTRNGYEISPDLGGISTRNGGDVTLSAGQNVISHLPVAGGVQSNAGSGAFGAAPGNVTVTAGQDVAGHYVVRNGLGTIHAGRDAGTPSRLLALSLISGGWTVTGGRDVLLQEVRNPNGMFNNLGASTAANRHRFDYAPDAFASLTAGHSIQLRGTALPRYLDTFSQGMSPIYPGTLEMTAGAGGVLLGNDVTLFPSPVGNLRVTIRDGGSLTGTKPGELVSLVMSDSGETRYRSFGDFGINDHAAVPLHLESTEPVRLDIAGGMQNVLLGAPKRAVVMVGGDMVNSRFSGQNLRPDDVTSIAVAGDIINRNDFTSAPLAEKPNFFLFDFVFPALTGDAEGMQTLLFYDEKNQVITYQGRMSGSQRETLLKLPVQVFDANGQPVFLPNGEPQTQFVEFLPADVVEALYVQSQDVPLNPDTGYRIGGGGSFDLTARNLDLGATAGIVSYGPRANAALANYFTRGADVSVVLSGNLDMFSTTISSLNGGNVTVVSDGDVNVGSRDFRASDQFARGIFTVDPSDVTVIARGNIDVNGSRIAGYDGGSVLVRSLEGNVDAGTGGSGSATVEKIYVDPVTRAIRTYAPTIPGSGILATTFPPPLDTAFPPSRNLVGDITVETPRGNITASAGGVVQLPLNGIGERSGTVMLNAGTRDESGAVIHEGSIDAGGSGVIGSNVKLEATGDITGLVFARDNIDLNAQQSVNVTALAQGSVSVNAGGSVSGTIVGVGSVNASGASVDASLLSQNVTATGDVSSAQVGFSQGTAAAGASQSLQADDGTRKAGTDDKKSEEDDGLLRRLAGGPRLTRTVGRVTVVLPTSQPN